MADLFEDFRQVSQYAVIAESQNAIARSFQCALALLVALPPIDVNQTIYFNDEAFWHIRSRG